MCKKWACYVRLVCALFCISCTLFLNTLQVKANTDFYSMLDSNDIIDPNPITITLSFDIAPTVMYTDTSGGTYSGSASGSSIINSGSKASPNDSQWNYAGSGSISGSQSITLSGSGSESGTISSVGYSGLINRLTLSGSSTVSAMSWQTNSLHYIEPEDFNLSGSSSVSTSNSGTISLSSTHGGLCNMHVEIPYNFDIPFVQDGDIIPSDYYAWYPAFNNISYNTSQISSVRNFAILDENKELITTRNSGANRSAQFKLGSEILGNNQNFALINGYLSFDLSVSDISVVQTANISFTFYPRLRHVKSNMQSYVGNISSDPISHAKMDTQISQENTAQETRTGILSKITEFFGSFFSNLINVFVPEDGYFTTWFNNLNTLLEAKLGILYYPFAKIVYILNKLTTAFSGSPNPEITFPAIEFTNVATGETYTFLASQTVNLNDYNIATASSPNSSLIGTTPYASLINIIRNLNGFILVMALLGLLRQKLNLILRGEDNDS